MGGPPADDQSRSLGERIWYLPETNRVRHAWRVVVPLVVGVVLYLGVSTAVLVVVGPTIPLPTDTTTSALLLGGELAAGVGAALAVGGLVARLDGRPISVGRIVPSKPWLRDLGGGLGIGAVASVCMVAVPVTAGETTMTVDPSGVGVGSLVVGTVVLVGLLGSLVAAVVFQNVLFLRVVITNVVDALDDRAIDPPQAVGIGIVASLVCYGGFELLAGGLVGGPGVAVPAMIVGLYYTVGYVFTGRLALPIGLHLGGAIALGSLYRTPVAGSFRLPSVVVVDSLALDQSLAASVRLQLVRVLVGTLLLGLWIYAFYGDFSADELLSGADDERL